MGFDTVLVGRSMLSDHSLDTMLGKLHTFVENTDGILVYGDTPSVVRNHGIETPMDRNHGIETAMDIISAKRSSSITPRANQANESTPMLSSAAHACYNQDD